MNRTRLGRWTTWRMAGVLGATCCVALLGSYFLLERTFDEFERREMQHQLEQVSLVIDNDQKGLLASANDYAHWDDAYQFLAGTKPDFFEANFTPEVAVNLRLDWAALLDAQARPVQTRQLSGPAAGQPLSGPQWHMLEQHFSRRGACARPGVVLFWYRQRPLVVAHADVTDSAMVKPARGCLLMARFLDGGYRDSMAKLTGVNFHLRPVTGASAPVVALTRQGEWLGRKPLGNMPALLESISPPRLNRERTTTYGLLAANLVALSLIALVITRTLLRRKVLGRLAHFSLLADSYRSSQDLTIRWPVNGTDELDNLGQSLNEMMSQISRQHGTLSYLADHDSLTSLGNRRQLMAALSAAAGVPPVPAPGGYCLLLIDLDDFKLINDSLGHMAGDEVLHLVADRIGRVIRRQDTAVRLGGDEFAILVPSTPLASARSFAERLLTELRQPIYLDEHRLSLSASIGIAPAEPALSANDWLRNADLAMYEAKRLGKHRISVFDKGLLASAAKRLRLEHALRAALDSDALAVWFQPIVDGRNKRIVGMEALVRWPLDGGYVPPDEFIGIAEESGLIDRLGAFVLHRTGAVLARLRQYYPALSCNVNLSVRQFTDGELAAEVPAILVEYGLPVEALHLELTESMVAQHEKELLPTMSRLVAQGFMFHLDDFGTGYSSLERLQSLPIHTLKIDRRFVTPLQYGEDAIARTVADLARNLDLEVIAEGVETEVERLRLLELGVVYMQGYLFAKPMPEQQLLSWLENNGRRQATHDVPAGE